MKESPKLTLEGAILVFQTARRVKITNRACSLYLSLRPCIRVSGRRKKTESMADMIIRIADKALQNEANGIFHKFVSKHSEPTIETKPLISKLVQ